jgi:N-acetylneuraminic acid mutarotase
MLPGETLPLVARYVHESGRLTVAHDIVWVSYDSAVARVDQSGLVEGVTGGSTTVAAVSSDFADFATVVVDRLIALEIEPDPTELLIGATQQLQVYEYFEGGRIREVQGAGWMSTRPGVAQVSSDGLVEAISNGQATIVAQVNALFAEATVVVIVSGTWTEIASMPGEPVRSGHAAALDGKVYYIGGNIAFDTPTRFTYIYDTATNIWSTGPDMPTARNWGTVAVANDRIHVIGGVNAGDPSGVDSRLFVNEAFDPGTQQWSTYAPMTFPRGGAAGDTLGGLIYVIGGSRGPLVLDSVEVYDPAANSWSLAPSLPYPLLVPGTGSIGGRLYLAGGEGRPCCDARSELLWFESGGGGWNTAAPIPTPRCYAASAVLDGRLVVVGGADGGYGAILTAVEVYDPATNEWSRYRSLPVPTREASAAVLDGVLYVMGGRTADGNTSRAFAFTW